MALLQQQLAAAKRHIAARADAADEVLALLDGALGACARERVGRAFVGVHRQMVADREFLDKIGRTRG